MRDKAVERISEIAADDPRLILITADLGFGVLWNAGDQSPRFAERFSKQFLNVGVAEQNMTSVATGLALEGRIVFTYSIVNFPTFRCLEQIRNDVCYHDLNVNIVAVGGGFSYGALGMSHHGTEDIAIMRALPNMRIFVPSSPAQVPDIVSEMVAHDGPCYLRIDKGSSGLGADAKMALKTGGTYVVEGGTDISLISTGAILEEAIKASKILNGEGISVRILDVISIKPIDAAPIVKAAIETGGILTIEEHNIIGGLGSAVAEICVENGCTPGFFNRLGMPDIYSSVVGDQNYLRNYYKLDAAAIVARARNCLRHKGRQ